MTAAQPSHSDVSSLARGGVLNIAATAAAAVLGFVLVVVVTRGLGAHGAGSFFEVIGLFTILANSAELGADTGLVRAVARSRALGAVSELRRLARVAILPVLAGGFLFAAVTWLAAPWLTRIFLRGVDQATGVADIRLLVAFLPLTAVTLVALAGTRGFATMIPYALVESIGKPLGRVVLVSLVLLAGLGGTAALLAWAVPSAVGCLAALLVLARLVRAAERADRSVAAGARPIRRLGAEFWRFSAPRGLAGAFQVTVVWLNILLVGALHSTSDAGVYAAVSKLVQVGVFATEAVRIAIAPQISALLARHERARAQVLYQVGTWWLVGLCWPLYLGLLAFGPVVLRVFGPEFVRGSTALAILSVAMLVNLGTGNVTTILLMGGKSSWNLLNTLLSLALNVGLNLLLVPRMGLTGAAIAWTASILFENLLATVQVWLLLRLQPFGRGWFVAALQSTLCLGGLGLAARALFGETLAGLVAFVALAIPSYLVLLWRSRATLQLGALNEAIKLRARASGATTKVEEPAT
ncbi:MAG TPA: polysaccharide biosynthesis C-terminal domain-containing protein [Actinomycetes bacterium]|nr:polysaccharide biosynthesis C-terminal domain-containing protein [Actinomycetes bacterium]